MFGLLNCDRLLNEQLTKVSKETTSLRVQNARLASQVHFITVVEKFYIGVLCRVRNLLNLL